MPLALAGSLDGLKQESEKTMNFYLADAILFGSRLEAEFGDVIPHDDVVAIISEIAGRAYDLDPDWHTIILDNGIRCETSYEGQDVDVDGIIAARVYVTVETSDSAQSMTSSIRIRNQ